MILRHGQHSDSPPTPGVVKTDQTITFPQTPAITVGGATATLAATSTSSLAVTFASTTTSICTVSGTTLTPVAAGTCHIEASQAGDATYNAAPIVGQDITVNAAAPVSGNTGTCTTAPCVDFAAVGVGMDPFGSSVTGAVVNDPVDSSNKVGQVFKATTSDTWGGATIYTTVGDKSVAPIDLTSTKIITLRVYSPAAGQVIMLKVENAADTNKNMEAQATTTVANAWETLTFDYTTPSGGAAFNAGTIYNKVSVFPMFLQTLSADSTYYFDELKYTASSQVAPVVVVKDSPNGSVAAYDVTTVGSPKALPGNYAVGRYNSGAGVVDYYQGDFAEQILTVFGVSSTDTAQWGFGVFIANGSTGWNITGTTNFHVDMHPIAECINVCSATVVLVSTADANCKATATVPLTLDDPRNPYTVSLSSFTVAGCTTNTMTAFKLIPVAEVHFQMLRAGMQFTTKPPADTLYPQGFGVGGDIRFD